MKRGIERDRALAKEKAQRKLSAVDVYGLRHRMFTGERAYCGAQVLFFLHDPDSPINTGVDEGDHVLTCLGCIALDSEDPEDEKLREALLDSIAAQQWINQRRNK